MRVRSITNPSLLIIASRTPEANGGLEMTVGFYRLI